MVSMLCVFSLGYVVTVVLYSTIYDKSTVIEMGNAHSPRWLNRDLIVTLNRIKEQKGKIFFKANLLFLRVLGLPLLLHRNRKCCLFYFWSLRQ